MIEVDYEGLIALKKQELLNVNIKLAQVKTEEEKQKLEEYRAQVRKDLATFMGYQYSGYPISELEKKGRGR